MRKRIRIFYYCCTTPLFCCPPNVAILLIAYCTCLIMFGRCCFPSKNSGLISGSLIIHTLDIHIYHGKTQNKCRSKSVLTYVLSPNCWAETPSQSNCKLKKHIMQLNAQIIEPKKWKIQSLPPTPQPPPTPRPAIPIGAPPNPYPAHIHMNWILSYDDKCRNFPNQSFSTFIQVPSFQSSQSARVFIFESNPIDMHLINFIVPTISCVFFPALLTNRHSNNAPIPKPQPIPMPNPAPWPLNFLIPMASFQLRGLSIIN